MFVTFKKDFRVKSGVLKGGVPVELPESQAKDYISAGYAVAVKEKKAVEKPASKNKK